MLKSKTDTVKSPLWSLFRCQLTEEVSVESQQSEDVVDVDGLDSQAHFPGWSSLVRWGDEFLWYVQFNLSLISSCF